MGKEVAMCEYCNSDEKEHEIFKDSNVYWYTKTLSNGKTYINCQTKGSLVSKGISIPFCPMCGRKLESNKATTEQ